MTEEYGTQLMLEAYTGQGGEWPWSPEEWERRAQAALPAGPWWYIQGAAGSGSTMRANADAFPRWRLRPRVLTGNSERDLSLEVLGMRSPLPFALAPVGVQSIAHPDGELAVARAARSSGVPMLLSTYSSHSIEEVASELGDTPRWFQLYWLSNREITESLVRRAEATGYEAIVVTVDTLRLGWREADLANGYLPFLQGEGIANLTTDPVFRALVGDAADDRAVAGFHAVSTFTNLALTWSDFAWLRSITRLPILAKGVLTAEAARQAVDAGCAAVIVSNHGGRQVDGAVAALDALVEVREALPELPLIFDSGLRRAADVLKARALGADLTLIGRPYMYGLAVGGQAGVERVIRVLAADLDVTLSLIGAHSVRELDRTWVERAP